MSKSYTDTAMGVMTAVAIFLVVLAFSGCAGFQGPLKTADGSIDKCRAIGLAMDSHKIADASANLVCQLLPPEKRAKCLEYKGKASAGVSAALSIATSIAAACGIGK